MIFDYKVFPNKTSFYYEVENDNEMIGQGESQKVKLKNKSGEVYFNYSVSNPHNDIMAFIIIIVFNPFIKNNIIFNFPVSERFIKNLKKIKRFETIKINGPIKNYLEFNGKNISIPIGGGLDSAALMCLFPDSYLYHQTGKEIVNVQLLAEKCNCKHPVTIIDSNIKEFITKPTFVHWCSIYIGQYLVAQDQKIGYILLGSTLDEEYFESPNQNSFCKKKDNLIFNDYELLSKNLGIYKIKPFKGLLAMNAAYLCSIYNIVEYTRSCDLGNNKTNCNKCLKCFRKQTQLSFYTKNKYDKIYWSQYDNNLVGAILDKKKYAYIFLNCYNFDYKNRHENLVEFINIYASSLNKHKNLNITWMNKIYPKYYYHLPKHIRKIIFDKLTRHFEIMDLNDVINLRNFDINKVKIVEHFTNKHFQLNKEKLFLVILFIGLLLLYIFISHKLY